MSRRRRRGRGAAVSAASASAAAGAASSWAGPEVGRWGRAARTTTTGGPFAPLGTREPARPRKTAASRGPAGSGIGTGDLGPGAALSLPPDHHVDGGDAGANKTGRLVGPVEPYIIGGGGGLRLRGRPDHHHHHHRHRHLRRRRCWCCWCCRSR